MLTGSCTGCGHSFTLLEGAVEPGRRSTRPRWSVHGSGDLSEVSAPAEGPPCSLCGAPLEVTASPGGLAAVCSGCRTSFQFVLQNDEEPPMRRPPRRESFRDNDRGGFDAPRARPCRACGGPLQFTTTPEGLVTGTCASCGNRFTLPPRREDGGRGGGRGGAPPNGGAMLPDLEPGAAGGARATEGLRRLDSGRAALRSDAVKAETTTRTMLADHSAPAH